MLVHRQVIEDWHWEDLHKKIVQVLVCEESPETLEPRQVYLADEKQNIYLVEEGPEQERPRRMPIESEEGEEVTND